MTHAPAETTGALIDRFDYDDRTVVAADFGPGAEPAVDVVDGTAILVAPDGSQREIDLPEGEVRVFNRNGVLSVEVKR